MNIRFRDRRRIDRAIIVSLKLVYVHWIFLEILGFVNDKSDSDLKNVFGVRKKAKV